MIKMNYFDLLVKEDKIALILDDKSYSYNKLFNDALDLSNKIETSKKCVDDAVAGCHLSGSCAVSSKENSDAM